MKRLILAFLILASSAYPQTGGPLTPASSSTGAISTNSASCFAASCVVIHMATSNVGYSVTVSGTWTGTLTVEQSGDNQTTWTSATTTNVNTLYTSALTPGITDVRVRGSAAMTGSAVVTITASGPATIQNVTQTGGGGGITSVTSIPATCAVGTSVFLTVAAPSLPIGQYNCITTNTFALVPVVSSNTLNVANFGVTNAGNEACDATFTNTSGVVTNSTSDPAFTSSMTGWSAQGTTTCVDGTAFTNVMLRGTITFNSAHQITVSTNANVNAAGTATQHLVYGPIEDTQLTAAENAAWNYSTNVTPGNAGGICYPLGLSGGFTYVLLPHFNTLNCNTQSTGNLSRGAHIVGQGAMASRLMLGTDFAINSCPTFQGRNVCFGAVNGLRKERFGISGGQQAGTNPAAATCMVADSTDSFSLNLNLVGYGPALANLTGYCVVGLGSTPVTVVEDAVGSIGMNFKANTLISGASVAFNNNTEAVVIDGGILVTSTGNGYGSVGSGALVVLNAGGTLLSIGDEFNFNGATTVGIRTQSGASTYIIGDTLVCSIATCTPLWNDSATAVTKAEGSVLTAGASNFIFNNTAGATFYDMGGNTLNSSAAPTWNGVGTFSGVSAIVGAGTGTCTAAATLGLYGAGQYAATTCTSTVVNLGQVMNRAGNANGFQCASSAAGVNASDGVCTVTVNHNGTLTSTITCTIGTGTSCADAGVHKVAFVEGDVISIQIVTQTATTLANIKAVVVGG